MGDVPAQTGPVGDRGHPAGVTVHPHPALRTGQTLLQEDQTIQVGTPLYVLVVDIFLLNNAILTLYLYYHTTIVIYCTKYHVRRWKTRVLPEAIFLQIKKIKKCLNQRTHFFFYTFLGFLLFSDFNLKYSTSHVTVVFTFWYSYVSSKLFECK